jgi:hypothetical protein
VEAFRPIKAFPGGSKVQAGNKPCIIFVGDKFESEPGMRLAKSVVLDFFRGQEVDNVNLAGLDHVLVAVALDGTKLLLRQYAIRLKKSGTKVGSGAAPSNVPDCASPPPHTHTHTHTPPAGRQGCPGTAAEPRRLPPPPAPAGAARGTGGDGPVAGPGAAPHPGGAAGPGQGGLQAASSAQEGGGRHGCAAAPASCCASLRWDGSGLGGVHARGGSEDSSMRIF